MLTWRNLTDVEFGVCVSVVSLPSVQSSDHSERVDSGVRKQSAVEECVQNVRLGSLELHVALVVSSVLLEEVINIRFEVDVVSEVSWSRRSHIELLLIWNEVGAVQLLVGSFCVLAEQAKASAFFACVSQRVGRDSYALRSV